MFCVICVGQACALVSIPVKSVERAYLVASSPYMAYYAAALLADVVVFAQFAVYGRSPPPEIGGEAAGIASAPLDHAALVSAATPA